MYHKEDTITFGTFFEALLLAYLRPLILLCFHKKGPQIKLIILHL